MISVVIPSHDRAETLPRLLDSVLDQAYESWECIVVDDGSGDETQELLRRYSEAFGGRLIVLLQSQAGKPAAVNYAVEAARGEFVVTVDSDDMLTPEALEKLHSAWKSIPPEERADYAGVEALCGRMGSGETIGGQPWLEGGDPDYMANWFVHGATGDRARMTRTELMRAEPYPRFRGEWWVPPAFAWVRMGGYRIKVIEEIVMWKDYRADGMSASRSWLRMQNAKGAARHYEEVASQLAWCSGVPGKEVLRVYANWCRQAFHGGTGFREVWLRAPNRAALAAGLGVGGLLAMWDRAVVLRAGWRRWRAQRIGLDL